PYDPAAGRILADDAAAPAGRLRVFERVIPGTAARWTTFLPGFPDGSYGYSRVNEILGSGVTPRLFVEYVGQGDSDKPRNYRYSTLERADLVQAQWEAHGIMSTFVVSFDYSSLVLLELLARQADRAAAGQPGRTRIEAVLIVNGGLFADSHSHPWQTTPLMKSQAGRIGLFLAQHSRTAFAAILRSAQMYSKDYQVSRREIDEMSDAITRRRGAHFGHHAAGFVDEHQRNSNRWDLERLYLLTRDSVRYCIAGSEQDPFEPRQIAATRARLGRYGIDVRMFPGGHLTTSEHPDLLASAISELSAL
ncbi:MAG TPA: alpha/beta hydrolase, partial [Trebonia sp.]